MKRAAVFTFFLFLISTLLLIGQARAATTSAVTATVTAQNISVSVTDGTVAYGTLGASTSVSTITTDLNDTQTATNDGNVAETFNIAGQNSANWTLAGTNGSDQYVHQFCTATCSSPPTNFTALTTGYQTLATNIASTGNQTFDLRITTPTVSSVTTQQSVDVTVQAVAF